MDSRKETKKEIIQCVAQMVSITEVLICLVESDEKQEKLYTTISALQSTIKSKISELAKKPKRIPNENSKHNLTKPCLISDEFSAYVKELRDAGKLGIVKELPSRVATGLSIIITQKCSSLLVSTLIISCDNYNNKDRKSTFCVTPMMKKYLSKTLERVTQERIELHKRDSSKELFNPDNYASAMNNVIASRLRVGDYDGDKEEISADLSELQNYLKLYNSMLRGD